MGKFYAYGGYVKDDEAIKLTNFGVFLNDRHLLLEKERYRNSRNRRNLVVAMLKRLTESKDAEDHLNSLSRFPFKNAIWENTNDTLDCLVAEPYIEKAEAFLFRTYYRTE